LEELTYALPVLRRFQVIGFLLFLIVCALALAPRIWFLRMLYLDGSIRMAAERRLQEAVDREGWLLSDVSIRGVTPQAVTFIHREHLRGEDPETCHVLRLSDTTLHPCARE
jgi:hypothetical protein